MTTGDKMFRVGAEVDRASIQRAERAAQDVAKSLHRVSAETKNTGDAMQSLERQKAISRIAVDAGKLAGTIGDVSVASTRMKRELEGVRPALTGPEYSEAALQMQRAATETERWEAETKDVVENLKAAEKITGNIAAKTPSPQEQLREFRKVDRVQTYSVGALQSAFGGTGLLDSGAGKGVLDLFNLVDVVPKLGLAFGTVFDTIVGGIKSMGPAGIAAGVAIAAVGVAFAEVSRRAEETRAAIRAQLDAQRQVATATKELTSEAARERISALQADIKLEQQLRDSAQRQLEAGFAESSTRIGGDFGARLRDAFDTTGLSEYREEIKNTTKEIDTKTQEIRGLQNALQTGGFAANDAAEAELRLADERRRATAEYLADFQARINEETRYSDLLATGTSEATQALIEADERRLAVIDRMLPELLALNDGSEEYQDAIDALLKEQDLLVASTQRLTEVTAQLAEAERNAAFAEGVISTISDITGSFGALLTGGGELVSAISDYTQSIEVDTSKLTAIAKKYSDAVAQAETTANNARMEADRTAGEARIKALESYNESIVKLEEDAARKRRDIIRKSNLDYNNAVANRDALAAFQIRENRKEELRKLKEDTERQRTTLQQNYDKQLKTIDANLKKQNDTIARRYTEQVNNARKAAQEASAIEQQRINDAIAKARQEQHERLLAQSQGIAQRVAAETQGAAQVVEVVGGMFSNILQLGRNAAAALPATGTTGTSTVSPPIIRPPTAPQAPKPGGGRQAGDSAGGMTINIQGAQMRSINAATEQQVYSEITKLFRAATPGRR